MGFILEHYETILAALSALLVAASLITKLTPTPKDDEIVRKLLAFLSFVQPRGVSGVKAPLSPPKEAPPYVERMDNRK
jgi:hypothetical protein